MIKFLLTIYEWGMLYSSVAYGEFAKVARFGTEALLLIAVLGQRGYKPTKWQIIIAYFVVMIISVLAGVAITKLQVPQINNTLSNSQNPQFLQILQSQQEILKKLK